LNADDRSVFVNVSESTATGGWCQAPQLQERLEYKRFIGTRPDPVIKESAFAGMTEISVLNAFGK